MTSNRVKVGIVGLGRWAKVLTRAARTSHSIEIVQGWCEIFPILGINNHFSHR